MMPGIRDNASTVAVSDPAPGRIQLSMNVGIGDQIRHVTGTAPGGHGAHPQSPPLAAGDGRGDELTASASSPGQEDVGVVDEQDRGPVGAPPGQPVRSVT